ncbi:MAG: molybdopterin-dependent oxidoreductase [Verrucomicrobiales bacterium]|nr:molybdopterin-dependent oxidoreductase [Verrucomicrobiales bacterium]
MERPSSLSPMQRPNISPEIYNQHNQVTRRYLIGLGLSGAASLTLDSLEANEQKEPPAHNPDVEYLTPSEEFETVERGNPLPYKLSLEERLKIGMERKTWSLDIIPDPNSNPVVGNPMSREKNNALSFKDLMKIANKKSVKFLKVMTCNNMHIPLGMGLWEGVPLRDVIWKSNPKANIRRAFYFGHHNNDPKQMFKSSLPIGRILEDPPGDHPVILCYKLNGQWLSGKRGGPVRMIVPEAYGFKSVQWLKSVVLTNEPAANDTYAGGNNDIDSWMKTMSLFVHNPDTVKVGQTVPVTGIAQVGVGGLSKVQVWVKPKNKEWPKEDPYFTKAPWKDAEILPAPEHWGGDLPEGILPKRVRFFTEKGKPKHWPMRYTIAHWATVLEDIKAGDYTIYCRTIDDKGIPQPLPRPFRKSGRNDIDESPLSVKS